MEIKINGKKYTTQEGETVLDACRREGIRIPTLCAHGKLKREAVCRLCLVEIGGRLVTSCSTPVSDGIEVITESERIQKARNINMELLWSDHAGKCVKCKRNRHCELQSMAEEYKIDNFHFVPRKEDLTPREELDLLKDNRLRVVVEDKNPAIHRTTEFCVECRRCINICPTKQYGFNNRAGDVVVGTPYEKVLDCIFCGACVKHCPTAALTDQNPMEEIEAKLQDIRKMSIAIIDPAIMESLANELGAEVTEKRLAGVLMELGFEKVFTMDFGLDKYVEELAREYKSSSGKLLFNSHCAAFDLYIKKYHPTFSKYLAEIAVPDELMAKHLKTEYARKHKINPEDMVVISLSSCVAKKAIDREYLDYVFTVRELGRLARKKNIDLNKTKEIKPETVDDKSAEGIIRSEGLAKELEKRIKIKDRAKLKVVNNMDDIQKVFNEIKKKEADYDFVEAMICPGGCIHGGGQSIGLKL